MVSVTMLIIVAKAHNHKYISTHMRGWGITAYARLWPISIIVYEW